MSDEVARAAALLFVGANTDDATKNLKKAGEAARGMSVDFNKAAESGLLIGKAMEETRKGLQNAALHEWVKKAHDGISQMTGGVVDLNSAMAASSFGPWGMALGAVGGALLRTANLMDGLGVSIDELEKKAQAHARTFLPELTAELWKQHDAIAAQNATWIALPGILANVNASIGGTYKILADARKEMAKYDESLQKLGLGMLVRGSGQVGRGAKSQTAKAKDWFDDNELNRLTDELVKNLEAEQRFSAGIPGVASGLGAYGRGLGSSLSGAASTFGGAPGGGSLFAGVGKLAEKNDRSWMETTFGPVDQFDVYAQGFNAFTDAVVTGYTAIVTGAQPLGEAFKHAAAQGLLATGAQLMGEGIKEEAFALGNLAVGDVPGFVAHQVAAAKDFAGAAAVGVLASQMGAGGGGAGAGGRGSAPRTYSREDMGGMGGYAGGKAPIVVIGDSYAQDSPRARQRNARRIIAAAGLTSAGEDG